MNCSALWQHNSFLKHSITILTVICCMQTARSMDDWDILADNPDIDKFLDQQEFSMVRKVDPADIVTILIELGILDILQCNLYCRTDRLHHL